MQKYAVVYFPQTVEKIDALRAKYDPQFTIIPPHITIVFPIANISEDQLIEHIATSIKELKSFPVRLTGLTKSFDDYLFLLVKEGNEQVIGLHNKLYSGILGPYLSTDIPFLPHITLGYFGKEHGGLTIYEKAYEKAKEMDIDIHCAFDNITLIKGDGLTPAKVIKTFILNK